MMEVVTAIANARNSTETEIVENYTSRQLKHIGETYMKDRLMVVTAVSKSFSGGDKKSKRVKEKKWKSLNVRRNAKWAGQRRDVCVIDMDRESPESMRIKVAAIMDPKRLGPIPGT